MYYNVSLLSSYILMIQSQLFVPPIDLYPEKVRSNDIFTTSERKSCCLWPRLHWQSPYSVTDKADNRKIMYQLLLFCLLSDPISYLRVCNDDNKRIGCDS
jgi:hypothetical protein